MEEATGRNYVYELMYITKVKGGEAASELWDILWKPFYFSLATLVVARRLYPRGKDVQPFYYCNWRRLDLLVGWGHMKIE